MNEEARRLINEMRKSVWGESANIVNVRLRKAADLIESLSAEREMLNAAIGQLGRIECHRDMLEHELEQVARERDAYLKSIEGLCAACKKAPFCILTPVERCKNWQWKGVEVEG